MTSVAVATGIFTDPLKYRGMYDARVGYKFDLLSRLRRKRCRRAANWTLRLHSLRRVRRRRRSQSRGRASSSRRKRTKRCGPRSQSWSRQTNSNYNLFLVILGQDINATSKYILILRIRTVYFFELARSPLCLYPLPYQLSQSAYHSLHCVKSIR